MNTERKNEITKCNDIINKYNEIATKTLQNGKRTFTLYFSTETYDNIKVYDNCIRKNIPNSSFIFGHKYERTVEHCGCSTRCYPEDHITEYKIEYNFYNPYSKM